MAASDIGQPFQIETAHEWVGGRLGEDQPRVGLDSVLDGLQISRRHDGRFHAVAGEDRLDEIARAAITVDGTDQVAAGAEEHQQRAGDGRHAAGCQQRIVAVLQRCQPRLDRAHGWIAIATVLVALRLVPEHALFHVLHQSGRVAEGVGRCLDDGGGDAVKRFVARLAAMHRECRRSRSRGNGVGTGQPWFGAVGVRGSRGRFNCGYSRHKTTSGMVRAAYPEGVAGPSAESKTSSPKRRGPKTASSRSSYLPAVC